MRINNAKICDHCHIVFDDKRVCPVCGSEAWLPLPKLVGDIGYNCVCRVESGVSGTLREVRSNE